MRSGWGAKSFPTRSPDDHHSCLRSRLPTSLVRTPQRFVTLVHNKNKKPHIFPINKKNPTTVTLRFICIFISPFGLCLRFIFVLHCTTMIRCQIFMAIIAFGCIVLLPNYSKLFNIINKFYLTQ